MFREISAEEFTTFVENQESGSPYQVARWGKVKELTWDHFFVGLIDSNDELFGASIVLMRKIIGKIRFAYLPRGPIFSHWDDEQSIRDFFSGLNLLLKKKGCIYYTVDPMTVCSCEPCGKHYDLILNPWDQPEEEFDRIFKLFADIGLKHRGFSDVLGDYIQARNNVVVPLAKKDGTLFTMDELRSTFSKRTKETLGNYHKKRGIYFETVEKTPENIHLFSEFVQKTAARKDISFRNEPYFQKFCKEMKEYCEIYMGWCDVRQYLRFLEEKQAKEKVPSEKTAAQIENARKILEERGEKVPVSAMMHSFPPNKKGIRIAEYLYAGTDVESFGDLHIGSGILYYTMGDCIEKGCQFLNLLGINHKYQDPLFQYKSRYNSILMSFGGEWDGVISPLMYKCMKEIGIPLAKKALFTYDHLKRFIKPEKSNA